MCKKTDVPMSAQQMAAVRECLRGEEREFFVGKLAELQEIFDGMPRLYAQDGKGDDAVAYLHYFLGGSDWWITERGEGEDADRVYGLACLNGWKDCAETGYISLAELLNTGAELGGNAKAYAELDFHFKPRTVGEIKKEHGIE
jgi:hypothetical protein